MVISFTSFSVFFKTLWQEIRNKALRISRITPHRVRRLWRIVVNSMTLWWKVYEKRYRFRDMATFFVRRRDMSQVFSPPYSSCRMVWMSSVEGSQSFSEAHCGHLQRIFCARYGSWSRQYQNSGSSALFHCIFQRQFVETLGEHWQGKHGKQMSFRCQNWPVIRVPLDAIQSCSILNAL